MATRADSQWTWAELCGCYDQIHRFEFDLPEILSRVDWPSAPGSLTELTESDLLFAHLFLRRSLIAPPFVEENQSAFVDGQEVRILRFPPLRLPPPTSSRDEVPLFPLTWLFLDDPLVPPGEEWHEEDRIPRFLRSLADLIGGYLRNYHSELLDGFPSLHIAGFRKLRRTIGELKLRPLTEYRVWLAVRWAIQNLNSSIFREHEIASLKRMKSGAGKRKRSERHRLDRTRVLFDKLLSLWGLPTLADAPDTPAPPQPGTELEAAAPEWRSGTMLDNWDLPDDMLWCPQRLREALRAVRAVPRCDLDPELWEEVRKETFDRLREQHEDATLGHFDPEVSETIDPVAVELVRAFESVLVEDIPDSTARRTLIAAILNAVYPAGYLSHRSPLGFQPPSRAWTLRNVADYARLKPKAQRVTEDAASARLRGGGGDTE